MSQVLYRKYRARDFSEIRGQDVVVSVLKHAFLNDKFSHAYLFAGPRGTGKTSMARLVAKAANCENFKEKGDLCNACIACEAINNNKYLDIIEIDAASNRGIEEIRQLRENVNFLPNQGKYKVYIIDEVHMLTREAFNALLKTLEEPPSHVIFVLATTESHKIPATILSRVQRFNFRLAGKAELIDKLQHILRMEGYEYDNDALELISDHSEGSYRDAESLLDKVIVKGQQLQGEGVRRLLGLATKEQVTRFIDCLHNSEANLALGILDSVVQGGASLEQFISQVIKTLRAKIIESPLIGEVYQKQLRILRAFLNLQGEMRFVDDVRILIEIAILELIDEAIPKKNSRKSKPPKSTKNIESPKQQSRRKEREEKASNDNVLKWNMLLNEIRKHDFKVWAYLRSSIGREENDKLIITSRYKKSIEKLQSDEVRELLDQILPKIYSGKIELVFEVEDILHNTREAEENTGLITNAQLVEALF